MSTALSITQRHTHTHTHTVTLGSALMVGAFYIGNNFDCAYNSL